MVALILMTALMHSTDTLTVDVSAAGVRPYEFSYDAVTDESKKRRKPASGILRSEDLELQHSERVKLLSATRDLRRNFSIVAWMLRQHATYVSSYRYQSRTGEADLDRHIERVIAKHSRADRFDVQRRFSLQKYLRLSELLRTVDGDVLWVKLASGHIQGIEGDRIRNPGGHSTYEQADDRSDWYHGVHVNDYGRPMEYAVHRRVRGGQTFVHERNIPWYHAIHHGYFDRIDQVRGVSPLSSAYASLRDVYENYSLALLRSKIEQLFALVFTREGDDAAGEISGGDDEDGNEDKSKYTIDFGAGPVVLDMDPGDDAKFLNSNNPSSQFQAFNEAVLILCLRSLDLPYSFLREDFSNFFGSRGAWLLYDRACEDKRADNHSLLTKWTRWKYRQLIAAGEIKLPRIDGRRLTVDDEPWEWTPRKMPWWKPSEEIKGNLLAIGAGLSSPQKVCQENDQGDWYENIDQIAKAAKYAQDNGVKLSFDPGPDTPGQPGPDETKGSKDEDSD